MISEIDVMNCLSSFNIIQLKARMQEPVVRSKSRKNIYHAVTSHVKFLSPKIKKYKIQEDSSFKKSSARSSAE